MILCWQVFINLQPEHVNAIFEDGILFLKYPMDLKQLEDNVDSPNN